MTETVLDAGVSFEISSLATLRESWLASIGNSNSILVNVDRLERIDTAGMQFLIALGREAGRRGQKMQLSRRCPAISSAAAILGLEADIDPLQ
jgi:anti-anti-sigma regulatory factor